MQTNQRWSPSEGATLLIPSGESKHLFVILTNPCTNDCVALVNFTTLRQTVYHDPTCVVHVGEHPFIKNASYVVYERAMIKQVSMLRIGVSNSIYSVYPSVDSVLFERICNGLMESDATPQKLVSYARIQFARK